MLTSHSVIGAIIAELYFRHRASQSTDLTFSLWPVVVCALFVQCLSIIFSCVPYLRPFFSSLESGMIRMDDTRRRVTTTVGAGYYDNQKNSSGSRKSKFTTESNKMKNLRSWSKIGTGTGVTTIERGNNDDERGSINSTSNIIRATTTFEVREEEASENHEG
jgi:hypothetical protein